VFLTFEEYKGRQQIVRGGREIPADEHSFDNPLASRAYEAETGGSTGRATRVGTDLDDIYSYTAHILIGDHVHGLLGLPKVVWKGALPDPVGVAILLRTSLYGDIPDRWFTPVSNADYRAPLRFRLATQYIVRMGRLCGRPFPSPEPLPLDQAIVIARWAADAVRRAGGCQIVVGISLGVRICLAAYDAGIDLSGVKILGGGEPFTAAKRAAAERVGADFVPLYISEDTGPMGLPCVNPVEENDHHFLADNLALIQHPREIAGTGVHADAFYFTTLRDRAAKLLVNMESDDYGIVEERDCGCALQELGYHRHVRRIRSFGKLTGEGVTLVGSEMIRILEEALPARYGGGPQDFQLLEEEDAEGLTRLVLIVDPGLDIPDERAVVETLLQAVRDGSVAGGLASSYWRQADTIRVRRSRPEWTGRGKLPTLRVGGGR
jgi:hypothetical protein